jgi:hypothetical protein
LSADTSPRNRVERKSSVVCRLRWSSASESMRMRGGDGPTALHLAQRTGLAILTGRRTRTGKAANNG